MRSISKVTRGAVLVLTPFLCGPAFAAIALPSLPVSISTQDDEEEIPDKRDEVKALLVDLKGQVKKRGTEDEAAKATIETLMAEFEKSGPKDRKSIVKGIADCFKQKRGHSDEKGYDNNLYMAAAVSLSFMGPESVKPLAKLIGDKKHRANLELQARIIQSLGKTKSEDAVKPLLDLLGHKDYQIEQAAAQALGNFAELKEKPRKVVFEEVLKALMSAYNNKEADTSNQQPEVHKRYDAVSSSMVTTLQALSGHEEGTPPQWQTWWNKNKRADWSELDD
ncbi:MAG: HEAT repeat domain-containing protein [Planctomycetota bacterium]|nr:HEAT repeat domain-containing protein [Planctomycetota bacterium]